MKTKAIGALEIDDRRVGVYGIGTDGPMYYKIWHGNASLPSPTGWLSLNGGFDSAPTTPRNRFELAPWSAEIFALGLNYEMFHRTVSNFSWPPFAQAWEPLGGTFNSPPDAISFGREDNWAIIGLGTDNQPYLKLFDANNGSWLPSVGDWLPLGGALIYEPVFAYYVPDNSTSFDIFGVGEDRQMYHMIVDASQFPPTTTGWQPAGGCFTSPPAVVKWSGNRIDIFGLGMDQGMYHRAWENGDWIMDWEPLGGVFDSAPAVVSRGPNRLDILGLGTDDQMYHKAWDRSRWLPSLADWFPLGGVFTSAPTAVAFGDKLHVFGLGSDFQMYHKFWNGTQWLPSPADWEELGGDFGIPRPTLLPSQLDFDWPVTFSDSTPIGGHLHLTLFMDGTSSFSGHLHDAGGANYACSIGCAVIDGMNRAYTFEASGTVHGLVFDPRSRDFDWHSPPQANSVLRDNWSDLFACGGARFHAIVGVQTDPPGGLVHEASEVLDEMAPGETLIVIPIVTAPG